MAEMNTNQAARYIELPDSINDLTREIIGAAMEVHDVLGPGLLERLYEHALAHELKSRDLVVSCQHSVPASYKSTPIGNLVLDMVINNCVVVELKSCEKVADAHLAQLVSYLRIAGLPVGLLINFHETRLKDGIHRRINSRAVTSLQCRPESASFASRSATSAY